MCRCVFECVSAFNIVAFDILLCDSDDVIYVIWTEKSCPKLFRSKAFAKHSKNVIPLSFQTKVSLYGIKMLHFKLPSAWKKWCLSLGLISVLFLQSASDCHILRDVQLPSDWSPAEADLTLVKPSINEGLACVTSPEHLPEHLGMFPGWPHCVGAEPAGTGWTSLDLLLSLSLSLPLGRLGCWENKQVISSAGCWGCCSWPHLTPSDLCHKRLCERRRRSCARRGRGSDDDCKTSSNAAAWMVRSTRTEVQRGWESKLGLKTRNETDDKNDSTSSSFYCD